MSLNHLNMFYFKKCCKIQKCIGFYILILFIVYDLGVEALAHGCPKLKLFISKGCTRMTTRAISCLAQHCVKLEVINLHGCNVSCEIYFVLHSLNHC